LLCHCSASSSAGPAGTGRGGPGRIGTKLLTLLDVLDLAKVPYLFDSRRLHFLSPYLLPSFRRRCHGGRRAHRLPSHVRREPSALHARSSGCRSSSFVHIRPPSSQTSCQRKRHQLAHTISRGSAGLISSVPEVQRSFTRARPAEGRIEERVSRREPSTRWGPVIVTSHSVVGCPRNRGNSSRHASRASSLSTSSMRASMSR
jgi:hypothetical protein